MAKKRNNNVWRLLNNKVRHKYHRCDSNTKLNNGKIHETFKSFSSNNISLLNLGKISTCTHCIV